MKDMQEVVQVSNLDWLRIFQTFFVLLADLKNRIAELYKTLTVKSDLGQYLHHLTSTCNKALHFRRSR